MNIEYTPNRYCDPEGVKGRIDTGRVEGDVPGEDDQGVGSEHQGGVRGRGANCQVRAVILINILTLGE